MSLALRAPRNVPPNVVPVAAGGRPVVTAGTTPSGFSKASARYAARKVFLMRFVSVGKFGDGLKPNANCAEGGVMVGKSAVSAVTIGAGVPAGMSAAVGGLWLKKNNCGSTPCANSVLIGVGLGSTPTFAAYGASARSVGTV